MDEKTSKTEGFILLEESLNQYQDILAKASDIVLQRGLTKFPIYVFYQEPEINVGVLFVDRKVNKGQWNIRISSLEEFKSKGLVTGRKEENFRSTYKDPADYFCIFVMSELGAQFIYLPRKKG